MSMESGYTPILDQLSGSAKEFILPSRYEAGIAATCVRSLAKSRKLRNVNVRLYGRAIIVWQGAQTKIEFTPPPRNCQACGRRDRRKPVTGIGVPAREAAREA